MAKKYQTGRSSKKADKRQRAKAPGKRKSKSGKVYFERRKNRSDMPGTLLGVPIKLKKYPKRPKASAPTSSLENYLEKVKSIDVENAKRRDVATRITKVIRKK